MNGVDLQGKRKALAQGLALSLSSLRGNESLGIGTIKTYIILSQEIRTKLHVVV